MKLPYRPEGLRAAFLTPLLGALLVPAVSTCAAAATASPPAAEAASQSAGEGMAGMQGHDMSSMPGMSGMSGMSGVDHAMSMPSALGPFPMTREGSGTSWQPEATPMGGLHSMQGDWMVMTHGFLNAIHDHQTGPRGGSDKDFTESMAMAMGRRPLGDGTLGLRAMVSLDPTIGKNGYPLLFETGETADGSTRLVDRQHPHDFFMELSASYSLPVGDDGSVFAYVGLPGEPALGPPAFMHRFSGMRNPEAPLTHHWLDSTHITFGVATLGASRGPWQIEGSWFNGREPDQYRWNIETRSFDSWSTRLSFNPTPELSMQVSFGDLKHPEQLEPETRVKRTTASMSYLATVGGDPWATTLAYGRNRKSGPETDASEPGWLLESTVVLHDRFTFFGRAERVDNSELFEEGAPLGDETFRIRKYSVGAIVDFAKTGPVAWGLGGLVGFLDAPSRLDEVYGGHPRSYMVFLQGRL